MNNIMMNINDKLILINLFDMRCIFVLFGLILFILGVLGIFLNRRNLIITILAIEILILSNLINFIIFSIILNNSTGMIFCLFILTIAAAESAIGLALVVLLYRIKGILSFELLGSIKG
jgi:NADH:ubiquinone oxidoreductase subunit K